MSKGFKDLLKKVYECDRKTVAVAVAEDEPVLEAVQAAREKGIADAILVGDESKIREIAAGMNMDLTGFEIINEPDHVQAAHTAVKLVHDGKADMYMKGLIDTKNFLKSVLDKEVGLRTGKALSHVCVFEIKGIDRLLFLSDVAFMTYPTLEDKVSIINNTVEVCHACGIAEPKVAPVAAVEVVNPKMPCTVDADELTKMNAEGKITGCVIDGPLSMDMAIDSAAAAHKGGTGRKIAGDADVILFPDIHSGNLVYKVLTHLCDVKNGNILTGTAVQVSCRLVGQKDGGFTGKRPGNSHPLLLSAGKLVRKLFQLFLDFQEGDDLPTIVLVDRSPVQQNWQHNIFPDIQSLHQVVLLKDKPDAAPAKYSECFIIHAGELFVSYADGSRGGGVQAAQHVEQGGFSAPGCAHDCRKFPVIDIQVDSVQGFCYIFP